MAVKQAKQLAAAGECAVIPPDAGDAVSGSGCQIVFHPLGTLGFVVLAQSTEFADDHRDAFAEEFILQTLKVLYNIVGTGALIPACGTINIQSKVIGCISMDRNDQMIVIRQLKIVYSACNRRSAMP